MIKVFVVVTALMLIIGVTSIDQSPFRDVFIGDRALGKVTWSVSLKL